MSIERLLAESKRLREAATGNADSDVARYYLYVDQVDAAKDEIVAVLVEALIEFRLGHEHGPKLPHTRALGDTYGWCDYCKTKVSWGPGDAEIALAKADAIAKECL